MPYIADTHSLIWFLSGDSQLSPKAKEIFEATERGEATIIVPILVLAEIMFLCERKRLQHLFSQLVATLQKGTNYFVYDLGLDIVLVAKDLLHLPDIHDRLIVATAKITQSPLITRDRVIKKSNYASIIW